MDVLLPESRQEQYKSSYIRPKFFYQKYGSLFFVSSLLMIAFYTYLTLNWDLIVSSPSIPLLIFLIYGIGNQYYQLRYRPTIKYDLYNIVVGKVNLNSMTSFAFIAIYFLAYITMIIGFVGSVLSVGNIDFVIILTVGTIISSLSLIASQITDYGTKIKKWQFRLLLHIYGYISLCLILIIYGFSGLIPALHLYNILYRLQSFIIYIREIYKNTSIYQYDIGFLLTMFQVVGWTFLSILPNISLGLYGHKYFLLPMIIKYGIYLFISFVYMTNYYRLSKNKNLAPLFMTMAEEKKTRSINKIDPSFSAVKTVI